MMQVGRGIFMMLLGRLNRYECWSVLRWYDVIIP